MDWNEINDLLKNQINNKLDILSGYEQIKKFLSDNNLPIIEIDADDTLKEFKEWLVEVLEKEPIPKEIKSIYFGLSELSFPDIENGKSKTTIYISGSKLDPNEDIDWACDTEYFPNRRYLLLNVFNKIDNLKTENKLSGDYDVLVYNGILNLLVNSVIKDLKSEFLTYKTKKFGFIEKIKKREKLNFGVGFDSGDTYLIGEITKG